MLVINALAACDSVIIPVDSNVLASKGLELFLRTIIRIMQRINTKIKIKGILLTRYNHTTKLSKKILEQIDEAYGSNLNIFTTKIPNSVKVGESDGKGISVIDFLPENPVSLAYMDFAKEVISNE
jgi:chromosome partitioning protein